MNWYIYKGNFPLGEEPVGSDGRLIFRDLKTIRGVMNRIRNVLGDVPCRVYSFTNFYDNRTFSLRMEVE